jgi:hypothetical protein
MKNIGKPRYGIIDSGLFGIRIVSGIITGIRYTEENQFMKYHLVKINIGQMI